MPDQSNADGEHEIYATVRIATYMHVRLRYDAPHPDLGDFEGMAHALERRIEEEGQLPDDVTSAVDYATVSAEVEPWVWPARGVAA
jgi:hypothetical protein